MKVHESTWKYIKVHQSTSKYTTVHNNTKQYTIVHNSTQPYTTVPRSTPQYTTVPTNYKRRFKTTRTAPATLPASINWMANRTISTACWSPCIFVGKPLFIGQPRCSSPENNDTKKAQGCGFTENNGTNKAMGEYNCLALCSLFDVGAAELPSPTWTCVHALNEAAREGVHSHTSPPCTRPRWFPLCTTHHLVAPPRRRIWCTDRSTCQRSRGARLPKTTM